MPKKSFTIEDLRRWQRSRLLSEEQLRSILAEEGLAFHDRRDLHCHKNK